MTPSGCSPMVPARRSSCSRDEKAPIDERGSDVKASEQRASVGICLSCGNELPAGLVRSVSLRCHDCRQAYAAIRPELLAPQLDAGRGHRRRRLRLLRTAA